MDTVHVAPEVHESPYMAMMELPGSETHGITEVCATEEMAQQTLQGIFNFLLWAHLSFYVLHYSAIGAKECKMFSMAQLIEIFMNLVYLTTIMYILYFVKRC